MEWNGSLIVANGGVQRIPFSLANIFEKRLFIKGVSSLAPFLLPKTFTATRFKFNTIF
jgi:hypothetical protein